MKTLKDPELLDWSKKANNPIDVITSKDLRSVIDAQVTLYTKYKDSIAKYMK